MYDPNYLEKINENMFSAETVGCGRVSIHEAKAGDIVIYTGGIDKATERIIQSTSFIVGEEYVLARDYAPSNSDRIPYFIDVDGNNDEDGHISVVTDNNGIQNGWSAALFKLKNKD